MSKLDALTDLQFAEFFRDIRDKILKNPMKNFIHSKNLINFSPTPAQTVALKCIFGVRLDPLTKHDIYSETIDSNETFDLVTIPMTEVGLYSYMTGFEYNGVADGIETARNRINFIVGRRGGKSTLAAIIAIYSTFKINWKPYLSKTPAATVAILSHSVEFSQEILDIIKNLIDDSPVLSKLRDPKKKNTQSTFNLKIPFLKSVAAGEDPIEYSRVAIKVGAASKKTTRGRAVCTLICDEIAYWNSAEHAAESDVEIIRAVRPALIQFGQHGTIIKLSSPGLRQGILHDEWEKRAELKEDYIQFKAPSWVWNTILPIEEFKKEWRLDPDGFDSELRANFVDSISNFISPEFVDMAIMKGVTFLPPSVDKKTTYSAAIDAAFKGDRFAFALVGYNEKRITNYVIKYWEGSKKKPVSSNEVAAYIRTVIREYGISEVIADQFAFQPMRELFANFGITLKENTFTLSYKKKIYTGLKRLIHNNQLDLLDIPLLTREIKQLVVEQTTTGQIRIGHAPGGSDDCVPGDTLIKCERGYKEIAEIKEGDLVYTHKGRLRKVLKTLQKDYDTDLFRVNAFCQPAIKLTGNHPLFTNSESYAKGVKRRSYTNFSWKTPKQWKKSYKVTSLADFELENRDIFVEMKSGIIAPIDVTTKNFARLLGYFIGDGWAISPAKCVGSSKYKVSLACNAKDPHILNFFKRELAKYGISAHVTKVRKGCINLVFHSKLLWSIFSDCYDDKRAKVLPSICYTHSINYLQLIGGWLLADGWKTKRHPKSDNRLGCDPHRIGCTTSKKLALELRDFAWKVGLSPAFSERKAHRYGAPCKDQFWLAFRNVRHKAFIQKVGDFVASKANVTSENFKGSLYNLHVEEDESYIANGIVVHNCSDALAVATYNALASSGMVEVMTGEIAPLNDYGIRVDVNGVAFSAPSAELLHKYQGFGDVFDNSSEYVKHPDTGKWVHVSTLTPEEGGSEEGSDFIF